MTLSMMKLSIMSIVSTALSITTQSIIKLSITLNHVIATKAILIMNNSQKKGIRYSVMLNDVY
jgi:hypothetical protein